MVEILYAALDGSISLISLVNPLSEPNVGSEPNWYVARFTEWSGIEERRTAGIAGRTGTEGGTGNSVSRGTRPN